MTEQPSPLAGRPAWRVTALGEADRLDALLTSALPASDSAASPSQRVDAIRQALEAARTIAGGKSSSGLVDWWSGTSIESAWQALHRAQEELVMVLPAEELRAEAPHLRKLVQETFAGERQKTESDAVDASNGHPLDPLAARRVLGAYHAKSDTQHQRVRALRNLLYVLLIGLTAIVVALWATGVTTGEIVGLGALSGALSVVFAVRAGSPSGPYNLMLPQALLQGRGRCSDRSHGGQGPGRDQRATPTTARDSMCAIVFGLSQEAFTRLVDQQAGALAKGPDPRSGSDPTQSTVKS